MLVMVDRADEMTYIVQIGGRLQQEPVFRRQDMQLAGLVENAAGQFNYVVGMLFIHFILAPQPLDGNPDLLAA